MLELVLVSLFQAAAGDPAAPDPAAGAPAPAAQEEHAGEPEQPRMECRREAEMGSRVQRLVCVPVDEIEDRRERDRRRWRDQRHVPEAPGTMGG
jgi:hypothetical protein